MHCNILVQDLPARLAETVCIYDGVPYMIYIHDCNGTLQLHDFVTNDMMCLVKHTDKKLDIATPPLGYTQPTKDRIVWTSRKPLRQFRQGITMNTLFVEPHSKNSKDAEQTAFRFKFRSKYFKETMMKEYPSLGEVLETVRRTTSPIEIAFSNDGAVVRDQSGVAKVILRQQEIGILSEKELSCLRKRPKVILPNSGMKWIHQEFLNNAGFDA